MVDYKKRLVEVDTILNYLPEEDLLKIPEDIRDAIKANKDPEYTWHYDETKSLKNQNVSRDTIAFLSFLNVKYLLNEEQKMLMQQLHELNQKKKDNEKKGNEDLFTNDMKKNEQLNKTTKSDELVVYNKSIFGKIIDFFRKKK